MGTTTETIKLRSQDDTRRGVQSAKRNLQSLDRVTQKARNGIAGLAGGAALVALGNLAKKSIDAADAIEKLGRRSGATTPFLSEMRFALSQNDVTIGEFNKSLEKINKSSQDAADGLSTPIRAFEKLGINIGEFTKLNTDQKFVALSEAISKVEDPAVRTQTAMDIMGRAGGKLLTVMEDGAAGLENYREEAKKLGLSLSEDQVKGAAAANDAMDRLGKSIEGSFTQGVLGATDEITNLANFLSTVLPPIVEGIISTFSFFATVIETAFSAGVELGRFLYENLANVRVGVDALAASFEVWKAVITDTELFGVAMVETFLVGVEKVKAAFKIAGAAIKLAFIGSFDLILEGYALMLVKIGEGMDKIPGLGDQAESLRAFADQVSNIITPLDNFNAEVAEIKKSSDTAIKGIKEITGDMADQIIATKKASQETEKNIKSTVDYGTALGAVTVEVKENNEALRLQKEEARALRLEQERLARATGTDMLRSQQELNRILDEAVLKTQNYAVALEQAKEVMTSRGLIEGTDAFNLALEDLGFTVDEVVEKNEKGTEEISEFWKNTVSSFQETSQTIARDMLDGFDNGFEGILDSLKDFLAAFLAQWATSGIMGLLSGQGTSGFSFENAFGSSGGGFNVNSLFGGAESAGQTFGNSAGSSFNTAITGAGSGLALVNNLQGVKAGAEQGGTKGIASALVSAYQAFQNGSKLYSLLLGSSSPAVTAAANVISGTATAVQATSAVATSAIQVATAAQATASTASAVNASVNAITSVANAQAAANTVAATAIEASAASSAATSTAVSSSALAAASATAAWVGVGLAIDTKLNNSRVQKGFLAETDFKIQATKDLFDGGSKSKFLASFHESVFASLETTFGARDFATISREDYFTELFGRRDARGVGGAIGFGGGNAGIFGNDQGNSRSGISTTQFAEGGKDGNVAFFTGAQGALDAFKQIAEEAGFATQATDGFLEINTGQESLDKVSTLWSQYNDGLETAFTASDRFQTAYTTGLINSQNLLFQNLNQATGLNADAARNAILKMDESFDALTTSGVDASEALLTSFSESFQLSTEESAAFFEASGLSIEHWIAQLTEASGEGLEQLINFNHQGVTEFEKLNKAIGGAAEVLESQMPQASVKAATAMNELTTAVDTSIDNIVTGVAAANDSIVDDFMKSRDQVAGSWDGLDLGKIRPIKVPTIEVPQQVGEASNDPFLGSFNKGGRFIVPGNGNVDRGFRINLTPGERVTVEPKDQANGDVTIDRGAGSASRDELIDTMSMLMSRFDRVLATTDKERGRANSQ